MTSIFIDHFDASLNPTLQLLQLLIDLAKFSISAYPSFNQTSDFYKTTQEAISVFSPFIHWIVVLLKFNPDLVDQISSEIAAVCLSAIDPAFEKHVTRTAASVFLSICQVVKPPNLLKFPAVTDFLSNIHARTTNLDSTSKKYLPRFARIWVLSSKMHCTIFGLFQCISVFRG